jgi:hypothetical protein
MIKMKFSLQLIGLFLFPLVAFSQMDIPSFSGEETSPVVDSSKTLGLAWFEPADSYVVPLFKKAEWGVKLPAQVEKAVNNWIKNDLEGTRLRPTINPFDPEQIDVYAEIRWKNQGKWSSEKQRINGFFMRDYERITTDPNPSNWYWKEIPSEWKFRIRWSPRTVNSFQIRITVKVPGMGEWQGTPFVFSSIDNGTGDGFISLTPNKKYYKTDRGKVFFPVGMNLPDIHNCSCDIGNSSMSWSNTDCESCYARGEDDLCCGVDPGGFRESFWRGGSEKGAMDEVNRPVHFVKHLQALERYKAAGANSYRKIISTLDFEIEFEKLNNYYDRQFMAWEFDELLNTSEKLGLKIELCLMYHSIIGYGWANRWDWSNIKDCNGIEDMGFCYGSDARAGCKQAADFFSSEKARYYFGKKLRYFIARYGYSSAIYQMELMSESNNVGGIENQYYMPNSNCNVLNPDEILDYTNNDEVRKAMGEWHIAMAHYVKDSLGFKQMLIGADYTGVAPMWDYKDSPGNPCASAMRDRSWADPAIDVMAYSNYDRSPDVFAKLCDTEYKHCQWNNCMCSQDIDASANEKIRASFANVNKALVHAEAGPGGKFNNEDHTFFYRSLWANGFGGNANSGMDWAHERQESTWPMMGVVADFFNNKIFTLPGFLSSQLDWKPGRMEFYKNRDHSWGEVLYMQYTGDSTACIAGAIMNRTWNPVTTVDISNWSAYDSSDYKSIKDQYSGPGLKIHEFQTIEYSNSVAPKISSSGTWRKYTITYYNPFNGEVVGEASDVASFTGRLKLKNFPTLTRELPFVVFLVKTS